VNTENKSVHVQSSEELQARLATILGAQKKDGLSIDEQTDLALELAKTAKALAEVNTSAEVKENLSDKAKQFKERQSLNQAFYEEVANIGKVVVFQVCDVVSVDKKGIPELKVLFEGTQELLISENNFTANKPNIEIKDTDGKFKNSRGNHLEFKNEFAPVPYLDSKQKSALCYVHVVIGKNELINNSKDKHKRYVAPAKVTESVKSGGRDKQKQQAVDKADKLQSKEVSK